jgi:imidazolonepropionase-like amidohydrolase
MLGLEYEFHPGGFIAVRDYKRDVKISVSHVGIEPELCRVEQAAGEAFTALAGGAAPPMPWACAGFVSVSSGVSLSSPVVANEEARKLASNLVELRQLQAAGVVVAMGSDNVQDPWYPGGAFDPVELLRLVPLLSHQLPWQRRGLVPFTTAAARLLDLPWDGVLREGSPADLLVLGCSGWGELLQRPPQRRVLRNGRWLPPPEPAPSSPWLDGLGPPPC